MNAANDDFEGPLPVAKRARRSRRDAQPPPAPSRWERFTDAALDWIGTAIVVGAFFLMLHAAKVL